MLSDKSKIEIEQIMSNSIKNKLSLFKRDFKVQNINNAVDIQNKEAILITISSYLFKMHLFFYFTFDDECKDMISELTNQTEISNHYDYIHEFWNTFCGDIKKELIYTFPHTGMSTPNIIPKDCSNFINDLQCDFLKHYEINLDNGINFNSSICISTYDEVEFKQNTIKETNEDSEEGILEFF